MNLPSKFQHSFRKSIGCKCAVSFCVYEKGFSSNPVSSVRKIKRETRRQVSKPFLCSVANESDSDGGFLELRVISASESERETRSLRERLAEAICGTHTPHTAADLIDLHQMEPLRALIPMPKINQTQVCASERERKHTR